MIYVNIPPQMPDKESSNEAFYLAPDDVVFPLLEVREGRDKKWKSS